MVVPTAPLPSMTKKIFHINSSPQHPKQPNDLDQRAQKHLSRVFLEEEPTVAEWVRDLAPTRQGTSNYMNELFPSATWISRYNLNWLLGDAIAGLTIGFVVVPQAMAYALLAKLSPEFGLYTSFTGAVLYWIFGTSKDIVIGTTAVGSLLVGEVVSRVNEKRPGAFTNEETAKALSLIAGTILLVCGLLRLGWVIEFIPYVPISAFVTAASITIMSTQFPVALGITGINTREAPYKVIINTLKGLPRIKVDAAIGLTSIALLFFMKYLFAYLENRQPMRKKLWSTLSSLRLTFTMLLFTFISWLVHRKMPRGHSKFRIVGKIESGFKHAGVPNLNPELVALIMPQLPAIIIILIIEHIAIAKSFGRSFNYSVNTSQEMCAQGMANLFSPFVGGYVCTGSFGASAVLSKAGVRTPLAGLFSAFILILALYALTAVFYYIPMAALAGLIIHAVCNLATPPRMLYKYWQLSPFELLIWIAGVAIALFTSLEFSIYSTIGLSFALLLLRLSRTNGRFMGVAQAQQIYCDEENLKETSTTKIRTAFLPIDRKDNSNPNIDVDSPYPGVFIYRFTDGFSYINQARYMDEISSHIRKNTCRTRNDDGINPKDRLWNDPGPLPGNELATSELPRLRSVVFDFSAVNNIDITSIQGLIDLRNSLDRHAAPAAVEWHFAGVLNRWTRRALAVSGFGFPSAECPEALGNWSPVYVVAGIESNEKKAVHRSSIISADECTISEVPLSPHSAAASNDDIGLSKDRLPQEIKNKSFEPIQPVDRPFFHLDLLEAVDVAVYDAKRKDAVGEGMFD